MKAFSFRNILSIFLVSFTALSTGCHSSLVIRTKHELVQTGLYGNDLQRLFDAYKTITPGKTTREDLEKMGIKRGVDNIRFFGGFEAYRAAFGEAASRELTPIKFGEYLTELERYTLIIIPFKDMTRKVDRVYFSRKDSHAKGWDVTLPVVLKDGVVIYCPEPNAEFRKTRETDGSFGQGVEEVFHGLNGSFGKMVP